MSEEKKFEHDCSHCIYLGHWEGQDLYFHAHPKRFYRTVVHRYGNEPHEYGSGIVFAAFNRHPNHATEAVIRALDRGLLTREQLYYNLKGSADVTDRDWLRQSLEHKQRYHPDRVICPNDTNGDGDCHLCAPRGGCVEYLCSLAADKQKTTEGA